MSGNRIVGSNTVKKWLKNKLLRTAVVLLGAFLLWLFFTLRYNPSGKMVNTTPIPGSDALIQSLDKIPNRTNPFGRELYIQQQAKRFGLTPDGYKKLLTLRKHHADVLQEVPTDSPLSPIIWFYQDLSAEQRWGLVWSGFMWLLRISPHLTVLVVGWKFIQEIPQRERQAKYQAWQVVHSAHGQRFSGARIEALQDLLEQGESFRSLSLVCVDLRGIQLPGANLIEAAFTDTNLSEANLTKAKLTGADLMCAKLEKAVLSGAELQVVDLREAFLRQADLESTNLYRADLTGAKVKGANFSNAVLTEAILLNVDLSEVLPGTLTQAQLEGALLCNVTLPQGFTVSPQRDCDRLLQVLVERYPQRFKDQLAAQRYVDCLAKGESVRKLTPISVG